MNALFSNPLAIGVLLLLFEKALEVVYERFKKRKKPSSKKTKEIKDSQDA